MLNCDQPIPTKLAARVLGMAPRTMENWRSLGIGPIYIKFGRHIRYRMSDLEAYMASNTCAPQATIN